jgi:UDP-glucose 4-epimerase
MKNKKILVTGGAGYIGSHVVRQLGEQGENVITLDNLATGFEAAVTSGELVIGDTGDVALLEDLFTKNSIDTVMHFAPHTIVPESMVDHAELRLRPRLQRSPGVQIRGRGRWKACENRR